MKSLLGKKLAHKLVGDAAADLPQDRLSSRALRDSDDVLVAHSGIPKAADSLAYEPVQRLLAVGCSDGRVKVLGKTGVEHTLFPTEPPGVPTRQLLFLINRGVVLRVTQGGSIECWSIDCTSKGRHSCPLHVLRLRSDAILHISALSREPYLLMGCASGSVRFATFISATGVAVTEARQVKGLKLLPYRVTSQKLKASGKLMCLSALTYRKRHYALCAHSNSGATVWDIRAMAVVAAINPAADTAVTAVRNAGAVTAAAWASGLGKTPEFATGHSNGDIFVWCLPGSTGAADEDLEPPPLQGMHRLSKQAASPIRRLEFVAGKLSSMLVLGGQALDEPEALTVVPLHQASPQQPARNTRGSDSDDEPGPPADTRQPVKLPWLGNIVGHSMVPSKGSVAGFEEIAAVATLMEEGQLFVHNLENSQPVNVSPLFQAICTDARPTCSVMVPLPTMRCTGPVASACSLQGLQQAARQQQGPPQEVQLMLQGGQVPSFAGDSNTVVAYCVGYRDGSVRLWDVAAVSTQLLAGVPSPSAAAALKAANEKALPATCVHFDANMGILVSGHERGSIRVYLYQERGAKSTVALMQNVNTANHQQTLQVNEVPGFHLKAISQVHGADICCITYSAPTKLVAAADMHGVVSLTDITKPLIRWLQMGTSQPISSIAISTCPLPPPRERSPGCMREMQPEGTLIPAVYLAAADSSMAVLDAETGSMLGNSGWLKPKHASNAVLLALLDTEGQPLWMSAKSTADTAPPPAPHTPPPPPTASSLSPRRSMPTPIRVAQPEPSSSRSQGDADSAEGGSPQGSTPRTPNTEDDADMEEYLAAAAAQMDAQQRRKNVLGGLMKKVKKKDAQADGAPMSPDPTTPSRAAEPAKVEQPEKGDKAGRADRPDLQRSSTGSAPATPARPNTPSSPQKPQQRPVVEEAGAAYVLMVTADFLRVYSVANVAAGMRTTIKKLSLPHPVVYAATFQADSAPGLLCLAIKDGSPHLLVYALPNLTQLADIDMDAVIPWSIHPPKDQSEHWSHYIASGPTGGVLLQDDGELIRLAVAAASQVPASPNTLIDWELAAAAHAANIALEKAMGRQQGDAMQQQLSRERERERERDREREALSAAEAADRATAGDASRQRVGAGLQNVFSKVQQGVNMAFNETTKGLQTLVQKVDQDLSKLILRDDREISATANLPELAVVFATVVPEEDGSIEAASTQASPARPGPADRTPERPSREEEEEEGAEEEDDEGMEVDSIDEPPRPAARRTESVRAPTSAAAASSSQAGGSKSVEQQRAELFSGAAPAQGPLKVRTASEIKAAYGRASPAAAAKKPNDVGSVMAENRQKLDERGERLQRLNERSAAMEAEAADFATMAKQLAEMQKNRKWWQM